MEKQGVVEKVAFGSGNQWTTIGGVRYATYWDVKTKNWEVGDVVQFEVYNDVTMGALPCARNIHKVP